jgi:ribose transport system substrate-binding protein
MIMPVATVTKENLDKYADMKPGTIVSPTYSEQWVREKLLKGK